MPTFEGWAVVELLGHRVRYGRVSEVTMFGEAMLRIEIPTEPPTEEFYSGKALYGIRPASEEAIRAYHRPRPALSSGEVLVDDDDDEFDAPDPDPSCGACRKPIRFGEPTIDVENDDGDRELWHHGCRDEAVLEPTDSDAPQGAT